MIANHIPAYIAPAKVSVNSGYSSIQSEGHRPIVERRRRLCVRTKSDIVNFQDPVLGAADLRPLYVHYLLLPEAPSYFGSSGQHLLPRVAGIN